VELGKKRMGITRKDHRHDENVFTPTLSRKPSQRCAATWTAKGCLAAEPEDFVYLGAASLVIVLRSSARRKEDARAAGAAKAATATHLAGQH